MSTNYTNKDQFSLSLSNLIGQSRSSFTLIELLVVLALVAILSVVVVMTLNPAELLKQARDSNRLSDLSTINTALNLFSADVTSGFMGTSTVVYVSVPDTSPTCANLGLPAIPTSTYTYNCVTSQNLRNTNGTGWIPVNFQRISSNSPISQLPIDPINTTSTRLYYTYVAGGSWELNATIEASKNKLGGSGDLVSKDGGSSPSQYEIGNNLTLSPVETGDTSLVGYWNFEEGPTSTTPDVSGYGNHGAWGGAGTHYETGRVGQYAANFNGINDYINCGTNQVLMGNTLSVSLWAKYVATTSTPVISWGSVTPAIYTKFYSAPLIYLGNGNFRYFSSTNPVSIWDGNWHHVVFVITGGIITDISDAKMYADGFLQNVSSANSTTEQVSKTFCFIGKASTVYTAGSMDDIRIYNRALSAAEISALYNATK